MDNNIRIADFYEDKSILLTGALGFVGSVLLEAILRCCAGIRTIYVVIRGKKGLTAEERFENLIQGKLFNRLRKEQPNFLKKIVIACGDVSEPNLGMSGDILTNIINEVTIVFHCAANINMVKPLRPLLPTNFLGTNNVIQLCRSLKKLDVLVYTSTLACNCNRKIPIEEKVYRLPYKAQRFLDEYEFGTNEGFEALVGQCQPPWPIPYAFSKCLSENLLQDNAADLPVVIVRPSAVVFTWKDPEPAILTNNDTFLAMFTANLQGFISTVYIGRNTPVDVVPVDVVAHTHIVAAVKYIRTRPPSPFVVNCTSYGVIHCFIKEANNKIAKKLKPQHLAPNSFQLRKKLTIHIYWIPYKIHSFFEHYIQGLTIDIVLRLMGKKTKAIRLYQLFDQLLIKVKSLTEESWRIETKNFHELTHFLCPVDKNNFVVNITDWSMEALIDNLFKCDAFLMSPDSEGYDELLKQCTKRYWIMTTIKTTVYILTIMLFYFIILFMYNILLKIF